MGAWGTGIFENDAALDYMGFIEDAEQPAEAIRETLEAVQDSDYIDYDEGIGALVAAAYVDAVLNGTRYSTPDMEDSWAVDDFPALHPGLDLSGLREPAISAVQRILGKDSEPAELMQENEENHTAWKKELTALLDRLGHKK